MYMPSSIPATDLLVVKSNGEVLEGSAVAVQTQTVLFTAVSSFSSVVNEIVALVKPLDSKGSYNATSHDTILVHWLLKGWLLHLVQRGWPGWAAVPPSLLLAVPNVTAHPSTASVPITVLLYDGPLLCGFNVAIEGLNPQSSLKRLTG